MKLTSLLLICFLELNFCEDIVKVQGSPTSICPSDESNSSPGLQVSSCFLMYPTGIAGKCYETLYSFSDGKLIPVS